MTTTAPATPPVTPGTPRARAEVRPMGLDHCLVTTPDGHHFTVPVRCDAMLRLLDLWVDGRNPWEVPGLDPALVAAAASMRDVLTGHGVLGPVPDGPGGLGVDAAPEVPDDAVALPPMVLHGAAEVVGVLAGAAAAQGWDVLVEPGTARAAVNTAYATRRLLVCVTDSPDDLHLTQVDRWCHDMRVAWLPVEVERATVWAGPLVTPGSGASYEDLVARRAAAAHDLVAHHVLRTPSVTGRCGPSADELVAPLLAAVRRAVASGGDLLAEARAGAAVADHPVLPMPHRTTRHRAHPASDLVDPVTGLVLRTREITHDASVPARLTTRQCDVADIRAVGPWANNTLCQGSTFGDADEASAAALGESVERYCGNVLDTLPVTFASYDELRRRGAPALDPAELVLYSQRQYAARGFPFVPLARDLRVHWVPGRSVSRDEEVLVPASLVYVNWYAAGYSGTPITNFCAFAGIAAGPDRDFAVMSGLEEVVERHATMVWWLAGHPLPGLVPTPALESLWDGTDPARQRHGLVHVDCDIPVPVVGGTVHDDVDHLVNIGFSARPTAEQAAAKAWTEALTLQEGSRDLLRRDGLHWEVMASGELNGRAFKPWRADRLYLDDFRPDMHDCDDLMVQQQVYLDPRAERRTRHLVDPAPTRSLADTPVVRERSLAAYREVVERAGYEVLAVDLTTPDVASTGMSVVRVIVPGTVGNAPAAFPFLGRGRVQQIARQLGWTDRLLDEDELNTFPLPHA